MSSSNPKTGLPEFMYTDVLQFADDPSSIAAASRSLAAATTKAASKLNFSLPISLEDLERELTLHPHVHTIKFGDFNIVSDATMDLLESARSLRTLIFSERVVHQWSLSALCQCRKLTHLELCDSRGWNHRWLATVLHNLDKLETLDLCDTAFEEEVLPAVPLPPRLRKLSVAVPFETGALTDLIASKQLREFDVRPYSSPEDLVALVNDLTDANGSIEEMVLNDSNAILIGGVMYVFQDFQSHRLHTLTMVGLNHLNMLDTLAEKAPELRHLHLLNGTVPAWGHRKHILQDQMLLKMQNLETLDMDDQFRLESNLSLRLLPQLQWFRGQMERFDASVPFPEEHSRLRHLDCKFDIFGGQEPLVVEDNSTLESIRMDTRSALSVTFRTLPALKSLTMKTTGPFTLEECPALEKLTLDQEMPETLFADLEHCKRLQQLVIKNSVQLNERDCQSLGNLKSLRTLSLVVRPSSHFHAALAGLSNLRELVLDVRGSHAEKEALRDAIASLQSLRSLTLSWPLPRGNPPDPSLRPLADLPHLDTVKTNADIVDTVTSLPKVKYLALNKNSNRKSSVPFEECTELRVLQVDGDYTPLQALTNLHGLRHLQCVVYSNYKSSIWQQILEQPVASPLLLLATQVMGSEKLEPVPEEVSSVFGDRVQKAAVPWGETLLDGLKDTFDLIWKPKKK